MAESVVTYLGLGGNLADRLAALTEALALLDSTPGMRILSCSSVYETEPWGVVDQPAFLNLAAGFETTLSPSELLAVCKQVESQVGRTESYRWGPRLIDVDILLYGDAVVSSTQPDLQIPHARLAERAFALVPLAEIAPDAVVPRLGKQVLQMLSKVDGNEGIVRWGDAPFST
ncbi:MAG: 2-amino-4-hydroxy-6-hydroxymethyldihydropteridine diphosphokinase [Chloroflexi bacterium]|nr:2-amino-4-hydroxy-6-hydroxymethyldihydropteridine diphosphokinase [Chloroflexota bacterium]